MSWEPVVQGAVRTTATAAPVALSLKRIGKQKDVARLFLTLSEETRARLGWVIRSTELELSAGSDAHAGWVRIRPGRNTGRKLRGMPKSDYCNIGFDPPDYLAEWECPRAAAEHQVQGDTLVVLLPWDLSEDRREAA